MYLADSNINARIEHFRKHKKLFGYLINNRLPLSGIDIKKHPNIAKAVRRYNPNSVNGYEVFGIWIEPLRRGVTKIQGCSVDLTLGDQFMPLTGNYRNTLELTNTYYVAPKQTFLAITEQTVFIPPDLLGRLEGKSTLARKGLSVHITSSKIDPGFHGRIVLECHNYSDDPISLTKGMPICALCFSQLAIPSSTPRYMFKNQQTHITLEP